MTPIRTYNLRRSYDKIEKGEAVHPRERRAPSRPCPAVARPPSSPAPRQTLYRVNCRLFRVGRVRQASGAIGRVPALRFPPPFLPTSRSFSPLPPCQPPRFHGSPCRRTHADSTRRCAHTVYIMLLCMQRIVLQSGAELQPVTYRARGRERESASEPECRPLRPSLRAGSFLGHNFVLYSTMCRVDVFRV